MASLTDRLKFVESCEKKYLRANPHGVFEFARSDLLGVLDELKESLRQVVNVKKENEVLKSEVKYAKLEANQLTKLTDEQKAIIDQLRLRLREVGLDGVRHEHVQAEARLLR